MLQITENDFRLTPCDETTPLYDLELLYIVNKGKKNQREEFKIAGYGLTLESAIKRIINFRLNNKLEVVSLKQYFSEFKQELDSFKELLK